MSDVITRNYVLGAMDHIDTQFKFSYFAVGDDDDNDNDNAGTTAAVTTLALGPGGAGASAHHEVVNGATQRRPLADNVPSLLEELLQKVRSRLLHDVAALLPDVIEQDMLDSVGTFGQTALMWAASRGFVKITKLLCDAGARLDICTVELGEDALMFAAKKGHAKAAVVLVTESARDGNFRRHGSPLVQHVNSAGWTALMYASANGFLEIAQLCVAAGANLGHQAKDGTTALSWAATQGDREIVAFLLASGAEPATDVYQSEYLATYMDVSGAKQNTKHGK